MGPKSARQPELGFHTSGRLDGHESGRFVHHQHRASRSWYAGIGVHGTYVAINTASRADQGVNLEGRAGYLQRHLPGLRAHALW